MLELVAPGTDGGRVQDSEHFNLIPAVLYAAKSTEDERGSIDTQLADCQTMASRESWHVAGNYSDEAKSAYHGNRGDGLVQAREHAAQLAADHGEAMLVVQHTDRLARGDDVAAQHLVEVLLWARKLGVRVRSVQDDSAGENLLMAAMMGERNFEDSKRKAAATMAGRRRAAERGEWCGAVPDGYDIERTPHGRTIMRRVVMHPERREVYRLLWDMAIHGATVNQVVAEFAKRGYRTAPHRARPRPFDATRVGKALTNCFYAGLMWSQGEIIGAAPWEPYLSAEDWYRLRRERSERARYRPQPVGRPPTGLLARLARCECGGAMIEQRYGARKDGSRRRVYTCRRHMHEAGACGSKPFDAIEVEALALGGLDRLLVDAGAWAQALLAGRDAERTRLETVARDAAREAADCGRQIEQLIGRYDAAVAAGDETAIEMAQRAWKARREAAKRAEVCKETAEQALISVEEKPVEDGDAALARLWQSLAGDLDAVKGERAALNQALRRWFSDFVLRREDGELRIVPILSADAARQIFDELSEGYISADAPQVKIVTTPPGRARELEDGRVIGYDDDPEIAGQRFIGRWTVSVATEVLEPSGQPGKQPPSRLLHNTRPGSWRDTAGGSPRRSRTGRPQRFRSLSGRGRRS
jgi:DNA invertase Pin-like site-specific DNA recombinase